MEKQVLLVGEQKRFMVNAIAKSIRDEGFDVKVVEPIINDIYALEEVPKLWVLYLDSNVAELTDVFVYMKDKIVQDEMYFYIIGNSDEIQETEKVFPDGVVTKSFKRPVNVSQLIESFENALYKEALLSAKKRILIVDDNPTTLHSYQSILADKYRVYIVNSGVNAITFLAKQAVDLILLDMEMPVVNGPKVLEMLREESSLEQVPVMFLTAKSDKNSVMEAVALKPEKYLLKTMDPQELLNTIDEFFQARKNNHKVEG